MRQKRYEYYSSKGKVWTPWFDYDGPEVPYQLDKRLRNEYRTI